MSNHILLHPDALAEYHAQRAEPQVIVPQLIRLPTYVRAFEKGLRVMNAKELLTATFPPLDFLLAPWLPDKGLTMICAPRGVGKTFLALSIAHAVATGGEILGWKARRPSRVIYLDGEMPVSVLQARFASIANNSAIAVEPDNFRLVASDWQRDGLPDLSSQDSQRFYESAISGSDLIIVDNLMTIAAGFKENDADSYAPVQSWMLAQRAANRSVLLIHHTGKDGKQRGTSRKEDVLDTSILLQRPRGYDASEGARFELRFEKSRHFFGEDAEPFEASYLDGVWSKRPIAIDNSDDAVEAMRGEGMSVRAIAAQTGMSKTKVGKIAKALLH
jgi:AAA domain